jgi:predicted alpha/beta superfamily hydrolase
VFRVKLLLLLFVLLLIEVLPASAQDNQSSSTTNPPVTIPNTETFLMSSRNTGGSYQIFVGLPEDYAVQHEDTRYSVIYLLDANYYFGAITDFIRVENLVQEMPNLIVVGIGYPEKPLEGRVADMLQNPDKFVKFVGDELIPLIDQTYRTKDGPDRTLLGHSLGGQFVLYTLFSRPELFARYVAASPGSPTWDTIPPVEAAFADQYSSLPVSLFMSAGERELADDRINDMFTTIQGRNYQDLKISFLTIADASHGSSAVPAFTYGLRYVYEAKTMML